MRVVTFTPAFTHSFFAKIKKGSNLLKPLLGLYRGRESNPHDI